MTDLRWKRFEKHIHEIHKQLIPADATITLSSAKDIPRAALAYLQFLFCHGFTTTCRGFSTIFSPVFGTMITPCARAMTGASGA